MKWLITLRRRPNRAVLQDKLRAWEAELDPASAPVPLDEDAETIGVIGPRDLPQRAREWDAILGVLSGLGDGAVPVSGGVRGAWAARPRRGT
jgi:hypothetical protein